MGKYNEIIRKVTAFILAISVFASYCFSNNILGEIVSVKAAEETDIILNGDEKGNSSMIGTYSSSTNDYQYLGYVTLKRATEEYRYLQITYTGKISQLRFEFSHMIDEATNKQEFVEPYWFNPSGQSQYFITKDRNDIPLDGNKATVIIDLKASGIDMGYYNSGIHMHCDTMARNGDFIISDARLLKDDISQEVENNHIYFGNYIQDRVIKKEEIDYLKGVTFTEGQYFEQGIHFAKKDGKYYKDAPIEWEILSDDGTDYTLISKNVLECKLFDSWENQWDTCCIREWLNSDFYDAAFTESEKEGIRENVLITQKSDFVPFGGKYYNVETKDKVYLLDLGDVENISARKRISYATQYVSLNEEEKAYWLRGYAKWDYGVIQRPYITNEGEIDYCPGEYGVRPVIKVRKDVKGLSFTKPNEKKILIESHTGGNLVTEDQLFYEHNKYLKNNYYDSMCGDMYDTMFDIIYGETQEDLNWSALKSNMIGGMGTCVKALFGAAIGRDFAEEELEKELALEYMQSISSNSTMMSGVIADTKKEMKLTKNIYTIIENGFKNKVEKEQFAKAYAKGIFSKSEIYDLIRNTESDFDKIDKIFKKAGYVVNTAEIVATILETQLVQAELIEKTKGLIDSDSSLYRGLSQIERAQKNKFSSTVKYLLKTEGFKKITDIMEKQGIGRLASLVAGTGGIEVGGAIAVASIGYSIKKMLVH